MISWHAISSFLQLTHCSIDVGSPNLAGC